MKRESFSLPKWRDLFVFLEAEILSIFANQRPWRSLYYFRLSVSVIDKQNCSTIVIVPGNEISPLLK